MYRRILICLVFSAIGNFGFAENWMALEGGDLHHNASKSDIAPKTLAKSWQRSFDGLPVGDQEAPNDELQFAHNKGSRNLVIVDGKLALLATEFAQVPNELNDYYCTVLNAENGATLNTVKIKSSSGNTRVYRWPHYCVSMSSDNVTGLVQTGWDPTSGILYVSQGSYNSSYTAWLPLANLETFQDKPQEAVAAFGKIPAGFQDAFGRTRGEQFTVFGPTNLTKGMQPFTWGLSGFYIPDEEAAKEKPSRYDADFEPIYGKQGSSYYNTSSYFDFAADGDLLVTCKAADWGHGAAGDLYVFNKYTGMKAATAMPDPAGGRLRPFQLEGAITGNGRIFCAGPSEGDLGIRRPEGHVPRIDQGLALWAYDFRMKDEKPNDGFSGAGAKETAVLTPAFTYRLKSDFTPDPSDIESYGQSFYECDGFVRNKASLIDGKGIWFAWKPSRARAVELVYADENGLKQFDLEVGQGAKGVDLWPKISLSEPASQKLITYYTGYAQHRERYMPDDPLGDLKKLYEGRELTEAEIAETLRQAPQAGLWRGELQPPRCDAAIAVFDVANQKLRWTYNLSKNYPTLPANRFWTYLDESQMVVAGKWAYVGWVDVSGEEAAIRLVALDITASKPEPVVKTIPLGFPSLGNEKSVLLDLVAVDGTLYALVVESGRLWIRDPRWEKQHVVALRPVP
jgi:hypothetical protein